MESNNIPKYGAAPKSAPLLSSNPLSAPAPAARPGKPPKLYTRLRMASLAAPPVIGEPGKRDSAPGFFGKRRMLGWMIGFLIAVVVALFVVIKLVQADVKNAKNSNLAAVEQLGKLMIFMEDIEKEKAVLKTRVAELEQEWKISAQRLQAELAKARKLSGEAETRLQQATAAKTAAEQNMATLKARLEEVSQKVVTVQEQAQQVQAMQDEIGKENQRQAGLAKARKLSAEAEVGLQQATVAKTAAERDMATLKARLEEVAQKVVTVQEQAQQVQTRPDEIGKENQRPESLFQDAAQAADKAKTASALLPAGSEANRHFTAGFQKWDEGNVDGSMAEFKKTISLDSSAAVAYYNVALGYVAKGDRYKACDYLYQAGEIYLKNKNNKQATRVVEFMRIVDPSSSLAEKLYKKIAKK